MAVLYNNWAGVLSFFVFLLLALPSDALPKRKNGNTAAANGGATNAAAATEITQATDGSMILDKTVTIKYVCGIEI